MEFRLRDFRQPDFEAVWTIDQQCFAPGISYSRLDMAEYLRRPRSFALVAESAENTRLIAPGNDPTGNLAKPATGPMLGFIIAEAGTRGGGHIITIDV